MCPKWKEGVRKFFAALRGPSWTERICRCSCRSPWPSVSSVDKRRCRCSSSRPFVSSVDKRCCRCSSSRPFVDQKETAVAVLRGPSRPFVDRKKLPLPLQFSVALRVLCGQKVLPLQIFAALRGSKGSCSCRYPRLSAALRGQKRSCICRSPYPFADRTKQTPTYQMPTKTFNSRFLVVAIFITITTNAYPF